MPEPSREVVEALFQDAADLAPARRGAFLDERCAGDPDLRAAVEDLLRIDAQTEGDPEFLQGPVAGVRAALHLTDESTAPSLGMDVSPINMRDAADIERAIAAFAHAVNSGLVVIGSAVVPVHRHLIMALAARHKLPAVYVERSYVDGGGLIIVWPQFCRPVPARGRLR